MSSEELIVKKNRRTRRGTFINEVTARKNSYSEPNKKLLYNEYVIPECLQQDISINMHNVCADYSNKVIKHAIENYINKKTI